MEALTHHSYLLARCFTKRHDFRYFNAINSNRIGYVVIKLFLDGTWKEIILDDSLLFERSKTPFHANLEKPHEFELGYAFI